MNLSALRKRARQYGIQLSYEDSTGKRREASRDALEAVLKVRMEARGEPPPHEPVMVVWEGGAVPEGEIELEDGSEWRRSEPLPFGYHTMHPHGTLVISAPREAHPLEGRTWGLFVPLYAVDETLQEWLDFVRELGGNLVATLPLLASHGDERSPYSPATRLKWNERYVDRFADPKSLYLDFPLGVHPDGDDVRNYRDSFAKGVSVGAPPDSFFTKGQNWGFPPLDPDGIRARRYDYFRAAIRHHVSHASILRLDHVMGLHRLYWIPDGFEAKDGVYVRYKNEELYAIVTLESHLHRCAIVGEDLGTVPQYVPRAMHEHGFRRMHVVQYEGKLGDPPRRSVASVNTHDMPTFAGYWRGMDIDDRVEQGLLDEKGARGEREARAKFRESIGGSEPEAYQKIVEHLGCSDAEVVLVNPEDLWQETQSQNVPGVPERSWKQRFRLSLDEARKDASVLRVLKALNGARLATR